jgi:hypothetical protein
LAPHHLDFPRFSELRLGRGVPVWGRFLSPILSTQEVLQLLPDDPMEHPASRSVRLYGGSDGAYVQTIRGPDVLRCEVTIEQVRRLVHDGMEILLRAEDGK